MNLSFLMTVVDRTLSMIKITFFGLTLEHFPNPPLSISLPTVKNLERNLRETNIAIQNKHKTTLKTLISIFFENAMKIDQRVKHLSA